MSPPRRAPRGRGSPRWGGVGAPPGGEGGSVRVGGAVFGAVACLGRPPSTAARRFDLHSIRPAPSRRNASNKKRERRRRTRHLYRGPRGERKRPCPAASGKSRKRSLAAGGVAHY